MGKALLKLQFALVVLGLAAALPRIADNAPSDLEQAGTEDREGRQWGSNTWSNNWGSNNNNWGANPWGSNNNNWGSNNNNNKPSQQASGGDGFLGDWLSQHNEIRRRHQNTPDVVSNQWLVNMAKECADKMASSGVFGHCNKGENIAMSYGTGGDLAAHALKMWYDEEKPMWPGYGQGNGFTHGTGHFTQVVWASTTKVGCALAKGGQSTYVVCNYFPHGNMQGEFDQNVQRLH